MFDNPKTESELQMEFVSQFRKRYPGLRIFAIPNGGKRNLREAMRLKAEGVCKGVPDLFIPELLLWIELKSPDGKGRLSAEQGNWLDHLNGIGHHAVVCKSLDEAFAAVEKYK